MLAQSFSHHHDLSSSRMTTSMVVTPPMRTQQPLGPTNPRPSRPKLSLNTSQARTFGKGSSLRLETLSAVSPTAINTFANGYEPERAQPTTSGRPVRPRLCIDSSVQPTSEGTDEVEVLDSRTPSSSSVSSASTLNSATIPYSHSQVLHSVLANSPLQPRANIRRMSIRPRFPAEKKVSFRTPLVEEIVNTNYTLAHSDISASDCSDTGSSISLSSEEDMDQPSSSTSSSYSSYRSESTLSLEQPTDDCATSSPLNTRLSVSSPLRRRRASHRLRTKRDTPQTGDKRDSSSESDSDTCPETPVAGRRKRRREWVWTLGTLPGQHSSTTLPADHTTTTTSTSTSSTFTFSTTSSASDQSS